MRAAVRYLAELSTIPSRSSPTRACRRGQPRGVQAVAGRIADALAGFVSEYGVEMVGGCCGTTPEHMRKSSSGRALGHRGRGRGRPAAELSSAMKAVPLAMEPGPLIVGERLNSQGSRKVKELLLADDYPGLLQIARARAGRRRARTCSTCAWP